MTSRMSRLRAASFQNSLKRAVCTQRHARINNKVQGKAEAYRKKLSRTSPLVEYLVIKEAQRNTNQQVNYSTATRKHLNITTSALKDLPPV
jgi:hypothetical protein